MRRTISRRKRKKRLSRRLVLAVLILLLVGVWFNAYVDEVIRPVLMQLAEYEAQALVSQVIHTAVDAQLQTDGGGCDDLYTMTDSGVQMDAVSANRIRNRLILAVQDALEEIPLYECEIPFGSLTGNSLLNGRGPAWKVELQPQGYVQARWEESSESLSINTTRYSAQLALSVTVNMVLDGSTQTLTVTDQIPLASLLLCGDTPTVYAAALD